MATYIALASFTDQGIRSVRETTKRAEMVQAAAGKFGCTMKEIYWTLGSHDLVTIIEASDDASATAFALSIGASGNVRTETMRAYTKAEMEQILARMG